MEKHSQSAITILIALAFAAGIAGSGCKRARITAQNANTGAASVGDSHAENTGALLTKTPSASDLSKLARNELNTQAPVAQARPKPVGPMCYVETFHHKPTPDDTTEETSSHHKNLMVLAHSDVNSSHICVRVNGIPVKFSHKADRKGDQILIGAVAGPTAKITVSYCVGKLTCPEVAEKDCTIPKDEFMDALGGGSDDGDAGAVQWQASPSDAKLNADVKKELSDLDGMGAADSGSNSRGPASVPVFKGWIEDQNAPACPQQAS